MIYANILATVTSEKDVPVVRELLQQHARLSRAEPGCARFEVYHSQSDPRTFLIIERWESQEALDVHRTAKGYLEIYKPKVLPLVSRIAHLSELVE